MKKNIIFLVALFAMSFSVVAQNKLVVSVNKVEVSKGNVYVGVYNSAESFLNSIIKGAVESATGESMDFIFTDLPKGEYAVAVFQDANGNQLLDMDEGLPIEKYGLSNNPVLNAAPTFDECKFVYDGETSLTINLK